MSCDICEEDGYSEHTECYKVEKLQSVSQKLDRIIELLERIEGQSK